MSPNDVEKVRAEHDLLRRMAPADRAIALLSAIVDSERGDVYAQVASIIDAATVMASFLSQQERERIAAQMVDNAILRFILRWH